ncbi:hydrolase [Pantoea sp. BRR-3P]|uniref:HAD family hydrolase n=1 Tax=Pantoea sp. BRR-3P TaxID=3141541 RepID=UPI0031F508C8
MKALIWNSPWFAQGDILFYKNCFTNHLIPQANLLSKIGYDVEVVTNNLISPECSKLSKKINIIDLNISHMAESIDLVSDPSEELYINPYGDISKKIEGYIDKKLSTHYDVILLWETPVPFLESLFPESLIIHQMPGAFCRAPYPHMVTFDPIGLYRNGPLIKHFEDIIEATLNKDNKEFIKYFCSKSKESISKLLPFNHNDLNPNAKYKKLKLLPLQTSGHYAFQADTPYKSQADFLFDTLQKSESNTGLVVTQYVTPKVKDTFLNEEVLHAINSTRDNVIFNKKFDEINSISQYLIPLVDEVVSCSSSIAIQSMIWNKDIIIPHDTFLKNISKENIISSKWNKEDIYTALIGFILNKQQVLASKILTDGEFLDSLIKSMLKNKKEGKKGIELYTEFTSLDSGYAKSVIDSFNVERASRDFKNSNENFSSIIEDALRVEKIIKNNEIEHITFDVFDTLINRAVEKPSDVYKFLEHKALLISNGATEDFSKVRLAAEIDTRKNSSRDEITLNEIYQVIKNHYHLDPETTDKIMKAEIDLELELIDIRPAGKRLWDAALRSKKPISIISDMYLPHHAVERILKKTGYHNYVKLYVSSSYGKRKKEGGLFDIVLNDLNIPANKILHIGDNIDADIKIPRSKGFSTFRIMRAIDRMSRHKSYCDIFSSKKGSGEKPRSIIAGLIAAKLFDLETPVNEETSLFMGKPFNLGYAAIGPMIMSYIQWVSRQAKKDKISRLYFLSREGWLLKQVYDELTQNDINAPKSFYLYSSRRASRVASIKNKNDILNVASQPFSSGIKLSKLVNYRFGLDENILTAELAQKHGFSSHSEELDSNKNTKVNFSKLCLNLEEEILKQSEVEREAYLNYLDFIGFSNEEKPGIVDIGWKANMQASLGNLINRPLNGYYYATLQGAEAWLNKGHQIKAYVGDFVSSEHTSTAVKHRHLTEFFICHTEKSLVSMSFDKSGNLLKNFRDEPNHAKRSQLIDEIHRGTIEFSQDVIKRFGTNFNTVYSDWALGEKVYSHFINNTDKKDAAMLVGYAFEDSFGGVTEKFIIGNKPNQNSVFLNGAKSFFSNKPKASVERESDISNKNKIGENLSQSTEVKHQLKSKLFNTLEKHLFNIFLKKNKLNKYNRDRDSFFKDSKHKSLRMWYKLTS